MRAERIELKLAERAREAGLSKEEYLTIRERAAGEAAAAEHWRASELAMLLASIHETAEEVWKDEEGR